jgi:hypothetical protein
MGKPAKALVSALLLLSALPQLHSQTPASAPADSAAAAPAQAPPSQAPDEATKKITDLVHAGNYAEAQQLTNGLLIAYPGDQRLIKAKALLDKLLSTPGTTTAASASSQRAESASRPLASKAPELTGMDKLEYDSLIELARQAQETTNLDQQKGILRQFMDRSGPFLDKHPDEMLLWQLRAASAISLNDPMVGYEAGQKLLAAGAAESSDKNLQRLLAQLNLNGWMDKQRVTTIATDRKLRSEAEMIAKASLASSYMVTNKKVGPDGHLKLAGYASDTFVLTDYSGNSETFRYDQIHTFQSSVYSGECHLFVLLGGTPPHGWFGWNAQDLVYLSWSKQDCSKVDDFVKAMSTLATQTKQETSP